MKAPQPQQQAPHQRVKSYEIRTRVNHPNGAPQFAAISTIVDSQSLEHCSSASNHQPQMLKLSEQTNLVTALPHARGTFNGIVHEKKKCNSSSNTSSSSPATVQRVQCFSSWQAPEHWRSMVSLAAAGAGGTGGGLDGSSSSSDDEDGDDDEGEDKDDNDAADKTVDDEDDDQDGEPKTKMAAESSKKPRGKRRGGGKAIGKKKHHFAFKRQPEKLPEAWFVLSPITTAVENSGGQQNQVAGYELFPLMEVFSCQPRAAQHDKSQQRSTETEVPKLFHVAGTRRRRDQ